MAEGSSDSLVKDAIVHVLCDSSGPQVYAHSCTILLAYMAGVFIE